MMLGTLFGLSILFAQAPSAAGPDWRAELGRARQAWSRNDYAGAEAALHAAVESARHAPDAQAGVFESLRLLGGVYRTQGDHVRAEAALRSAIEQYPAGSEPGTDVAAALAELAAVERAQGHAEAALASIGKAIAIREMRPDSRRDELARDLSTAAVLRLETGAMDAGIEGLQRAVAEWDAAAPGDARSLPALEALAGVYRDRAQYSEAEPLLLRALRLREATGSPDSAEVITAVDSLAYVEFGLRKMPEAEVLYGRLLALWEKNAGPEHPMVALTLDKMAEFYAFQQRYDEAGKCARRSLALRTLSHVASLNQTGRVLLMEAKLGEAEDLYRRTVQIGDLAQAPDEALDPPLRIYARVLRELERPDEAAAIEKRVKAALLRKADREGRRPAPGQPPVSRPVPSGDRQK